jgi:cytochrome c-type biogenesis protein CcmH
MRTILAIFLLIFAFLTWQAPSRPALAQESEEAGPSDDEVNAIAKQLYCPVCENIPLDVCPTQACAQWRDLIRQKLVEGWSEQQIKNYFVEQYGDRVLGTPPRRGFNWLFYLVPPVALVAGVLILIQALRTLRRQPGTRPVVASTPSGEVDDEYIRRLEEELRKKN